MFKLEFASELALKLKAKLNKPLPKSEKNSKTSPDVFVAKSTLSAVCSSDDENEIDWFKTPSTSPPKEEQIKKPPSEMKKVSLFDDTDNEDNDDDLFNWAAAAKPILKIEPDYVENVDSLFGETDDLFAFKTSGTTSLKKHSAINPPAVVMSGAAAASKPKTIGLFDNTPEQSVHQAKKLPQHVPKASSLFGKFGKNRIIKFLS